MVLLLLLLFISFFFVLPLYAEYFKHIGLSEGLAQPSVMAIYQDRLGRMWFGTREGISQYDGNRIRVFKGWIASVGEEPSVWLGNEVSFIVGDSLDNLYFLIDKNLIKGKRILIIDDIITTGSTLGECARILNKCKCGEICCCTLCTSLLI